MRFAYIDSQGKEVGIPSVEALQLRIELGAITEATEFFDANQDRWAPAGEHEIFRTLSRELKERDGEAFVAPPPPSMGGIQWPGEGPGQGKGQKQGEGPGDAEAAPGPGPESGGKAPGDAAGATEAPRADEKRRAPNPFEMEEGPGGAAAPPESPESPQAPEPPEPPQPPEEKKPGGGDAFDFGEFGSLELVDQEDETVEAPEPVEQPDAMGGFDLVEDPDAPEEEPAAPPAPSAEDPDAPSAEDPDAPSAFDFGGGLQLEDSFAEQHGGEADEADEPVAADSGMEMEQPLSDFSAHEPPSWMDEGQEGLELEDAADASWGEAAAPSTRPRGPEGGEADRSDDRRPEAREGGGDGRGGGDDGDDARPSRRPTRPAPPPRRSSGVPTGLVAAVAVLVLAGAGWFGWRAMSGGEVVVEEEPVVEIPELPSALEPTLAEAAPPAYRETLDSLRSLGRELPTSPDEDWLAGVYLANASSYEGIEEYWAAMADYLATIRDSEEEIFMAALDERLDDLEVTGDDRSLLRRRARAGFQSARRDRRVTYDQFAGVIEASLTLHQFLLGNEGQIDYEPAASGLSRDPVTEAIPSTETLGDEMWDRVGEITNSLDSLGALDVLDRITTDRLLDIVFERLARTSLH